MHTFKGENGLRIHYNSDFSGDVIISREGMPWWSARFPAADILGFAEHARKLIEEREAQAFANEMIGLGLAVPVVPPEMQQYLDDQPTLVLETTHPTVPLDPDDGLNINDW